MPVKGSRASAPEVTPNSLTGSGCTQPLAGCDSEFLSCSSLYCWHLQKNVSFFAMEGDIYFSCLGSNKSSSRQAIISHPQGSLPNGGRCHLAGLCWGFSQHTALLCVSLGRAEPHGWLQQVYGYFSSKGESHRSTISCKQGELVNIKSVVSVVKFDYLQLRL